MKCACIGRCRFLVIVLLMISVVGPDGAIATDVPAVLPRPTKTPPTDGKVKVYILAGQSNMVGFGYLDGAKPVYPSIYLSADPKTKIGRMPVGNSALLKHGVYQTAAPNSQSGAIGYLYPGKYDASKDYDSLEPVKKTTFALGNVEEQLPAMDRPYTLVGKAYIDVPIDGTYEVHAGFDESANAVVSLFGKEVYEKQSGQSATVVPIELKQGKRYPISITYKKGGSAAFWLKQINLAGKGDLRSLIQDGKYTWFADDNHQWTVRNDVTYWETRINKQGGAGGPLSATSNGKFIGPEVPFGFVMGTFHAEPVLLIESSMGNRSLSFDFRPPSSGNEKETNNQFCGLEYDLMVEGVRNALNNIDSIVPNYKGQGYEIAGFVWFQGHKDKNVPKTEYEKHLVNLIQDLRKEFKVPDLRTVIATVGFGGMNMDPGHKMTWEAQMAVGDTIQHPELAGTVASVDTRKFWRNRGDSPTNTGYHYNHNAETYVLTGDALGRAMVRLHGGQAEELPIQPKQKRNKDVETVYSDEVTGRFNKRGPHYPADYYREMGQTLKPIILDEMVPRFLQTAFAPSSRGALKGVVSGIKPQKMPGDIRSDLDTLMDYYDMAGVAGYQWMPFGPDIRNATWSYFSFDPPEKQQLEKSDRFRSVTLPDGMENWFAANFDPGEFGWKLGRAPFGQMGGQLDRRRPVCNGTHCGCSDVPATLWEKEVLLMRQTFDIPPVKQDHVYRLILGGAGCDRSGEGFAIYVNGKLLTQVDGGFFRHTGIRGAYIYDDILTEFKSGKVTIAVINFLRYTHFRNKTTYFGPHRDYYGKPVPANGHVSVWLEEAKLSPATLNAALKAR